MDKSENCSLKNINKWQTNKFVICIKYAPLFNYKQMKDGNYTFEGMFKNFLDDAKEYFNMRYLVYRKMIKYVN